SRRGCRRQDFLASANLGNEADLMSRGAFQEIAILLAFKAVERRNLAKNEIRIEPVAQQGLSLGATSGFNYAVAGSLENHSDHSARLRARNNTKSEQQRSHQGPLSRNTTKLH